jgi:hypothetical protein
MRSARTGIQVVANAGQSLSMTPLNPRTELQLSRSRIICDFGCRKKESLHFIKHRNGCRTRDGGLPKAIYAGPNDVLVQ